MASRVEAQILSAFTRNTQLKFSEIEKHVGERSNKLSYHIKNLVRSGALLKEGEYYILSKDYEEQIPYLSDNASPLPVLLLALKNSEGSVFLVRRDKRPFKDKLGLPGGRIRVGESLEEAAKRIGKKWGVSVGFSKVTSVNLEHVTNEGGIVHSFLLILVECEASSKNIEYVDIEEYRGEIIESDYTLLKNNLHNTINIKELKTPHL